MPDLAILYDHDQDNWLRFADPLEIVETSDLSRVVPLLRHVEERIEREGLFAAGFLSYEAAPAFDTAFLTHDPDGFPLLRFGLFGQPETIELESFEHDPHTVEWTPGLSPESFTRAVNSIRDAIARGETYQVNVTFPLQASIRQAPWDFFRQLVRGRTLPGAAYLETPDWAVCSASPELFFRRDQDRLVMRPMKGTTQRGLTLAEDRDRADALARSEKNRAENVMILDMVRNDLGRLAPPGQVRVDALYELEKYPTVWQMTSTASARTQASLVECFRALFPCASITGAPKAQTMQIIAGLETGPRRIYTGAIGWLAPGQKAHFNVAIRTALIKKATGQATYGVGAGITWSSDPADEYRECLDKAAILRRPLPDFALFETVRWTPKHGYFILREHLDRLIDSAEYFSFPCQRQQVRTFLEEQAEEFPAEPQRVRLTLHRNGQLVLERQSLHQDPPGPITIKLADSPVAIGSPFLYHKTTFREVYDQQIKNRGKADEVVLWNEREEITECCTANLVLARDGELVTPATECGLLPGTYRAFLLRKGVIREQVLTIDDVRRSDRIYLVNALRKWRLAVLQE